jgi:hypothetical protein
MARYFCLDTKVSKKSSQQIGFSAHKASLTLNPSPKERNLKKSPLLGEI